MNGSRPLANVAAAESKRKRRLGWLLSTPALIAGLVVTVYPLFYLLAASFSKSTLGRPFQAWIGGENFSQALGDQAFTESVARTVAVAVLGALLQVALGLGIALMLKQLTLGRSVIRTLILLPMLTPPVMAAVVWKLFLDPNGGLLNSVLSNLGLISEPLSLLGSPTWSVYMVALADTWQWTPFVALIVFAALMALPDEVYEAAQVEGASGWQTFRYVTLPMVLPALTSVFMIKLIMSFKIFDLIYVLTAGGPGNSSLLSGYLIFRTALREFNVGYASAQTILFVLVVTIVTIPVTMISKRVKW